MVVLGHTNDLHGGIGGLTERPPTEGPLNIFTLTECPPNGTSTWTFHPLDI
jgi:hypothetical protein